MKLDNLDNNSKIWIYIADRFLTSNEIDRISEELSAFLKNWSAHGAALFSGFSIEANRTIIVGVDEKQAVASGCSIDKLVHFFKKQGEEMGVNFFDRMQVMFEKDGQIEFTPLNNFWAMRKANIITDHTLIFDTTVQNLGEWRDGWKKKFSSSWHAEAWGR
jgi:hypothetical protein